MYILFFILEGFIVLGEEVFFVVIEVCVVYLVFICVMIS